MTTATDRTHPRYNLSAAAGLRLQVVEADRAVQREWAVNSVPLFSRVGFHRRTLRTSGVPVVAANKDDRQIVDHASTWNHVISGLRRRSAPYSVGANQQPYTLQPSCRCSLRAVRRSPEIDVGESPGTEL